MVAMDVVYTASLPHRNSRRAGKVIRRRHARGDVLFTVRADVGSGDRRPASGLDFLDPIAVPVIVESCHRQSRGTRHGDQAILHIPSLRVGDALGVRPLRAAQVRTGDRSGLCDSVDTPPLAAGLGLTTAPKRIQTVIHDFDFLAAGNFCLEDTTGELKSRTLVID